MPKTGIKEQLVEISGRMGGTASFDENLSKHSTIGIGGCAWCWYEPSSEAELAELRLFLSGKSVRSKLIGSGSNVLLPSETLDAVAINLSNPCFRKKDFKGTTVTVGAGEKLASLIRETCGRSLEGFEGLVGIPGTVGGSLVTNAGYIATISDTLKSVKLMDKNGRVKWADKKDLSFFYRGSSFDRDDIILEAVFELKEAGRDEIMARMKQYIQKKVRTQPMEQKTLGCVFKNPEKNLYRSAEMIDKAGLKGLTCGGAFVSDKHANFIVNMGGATAGDVKELIRKIKRKVDNVFGVDLELEIEIIE